VTICGIRFGFVVYVLNPVRFVAYVLTLALFMLGMGSVLCCCEVRICCCDLVAGYVVVMFGSVVMVLCCCDSVL